MKPPTSFDAPQGIELRLPDGTVFPVVVGSLHVEQEVTERARSETAVKADPDWSYRDVAGHLHRTVDGTWPTLEPAGRHVPCDGSLCGGVCGGAGYTEPYYVCVDCGVEITPGTVPDELARGQGIPVTGERVVAFKVLDHQMVLAHRLYGDARVLTLSATLPATIVGAVLVRDSGGFEPDETEPLPPLVACHMQVRHDGLLEVEVEAREYVNLIPRRTRA